MWQRAISGSGEGRSGIEEVEYRTFSLAANAKFNISVTKKALGIAYCFGTDANIRYCYDGLNNNKIFVNGTEVSATCTFTDSAITSDVGISGSARNVYMVIIY